MTRGPTGAFTLLPSTAPFAFRGALWRGRIAVVFEMVAVAGRNIIRH